MQKSLTQQKQNFQKPREISRKIHKKIVLYNPKTLIIKNIKTAKNQKLPSPPNQTTSSNTQQMQTYSKYSSYIPQSSFMKCYGTSQKYGYASSSPLGSASTLNPEFSSTSAQDKNINANLGARSCINSTHVKIRKYYKILNVQQDCSDLELRRAYRKLALEIHPDKISKQQQKQPQETPSSQAFRLLNKIYSKIVAYRKKFPQSLQLSPSTSSNPQPYAYPQPESPMAQNRSLFKQFQYNLNQHLQTLDNILDCLNSMKRQPREGGY